ncbi:hypothetical protein JI749_13335 [Devosia oryziradicis]|uniref:Oligosaccharide repeat unit polymerase n=1 Tax=Devosia oryziradicis TaxID=2801335 RepID=A0ABX7BTT5_9HYPH|nr:hypothetical protein [Devosia oryziradicis]QQR35332.1 hypothetical protein JI749_13335 [Devosia oryziradicis]
MPFRYIVLFCFAAPLVGIMQMEAGSYGGSVLQSGHPNSATLAFGLGIAAFTASLMLARALISFRFDWLSPRPAPVPDDRIWILATLSLAGMALFTMFVAGGINVISRTIGRGDFRTELGDAGAISYLILKYYSPAIMAYLALIYARRPWYDAAIPLAVPAIIVALIALSFGFKSGVVLAFLPAAVVYFWRVPDWMVIPLAALAFLGIYVGYSFFDGLSDPSTILDRLFYRLTVLQGDVAWKIWDLHARGDVLPSYIASLPAIFGDRVFTLVTGIDRTMELDWVATHFGLLTTYLSGYPIHVIMAGHNNTATIFSEGVLIGGLSGVIGIFAFAGVLTAALYDFIRVCLQRNRYVEASLASSYFVFALMAWLLGGGITAILHISILAGLVTGYVLLKIIEGRRGDTGAEVYAI